MSTANRCVPFNPDAATPLMAVAEHFRSEQLDNIGPSQHVAKAYVMGCIEGEFAFALACAGIDAEIAVLGCCDALLLRLGLVGEALSVEQVRLKGWIAGLMTSLSSSFEEDAKDIGTLDVSVAYNTSTDEVRHADR